MACLNSLGYSHSRSQKGVTVPVYQCSKHGFCVASEKEGELVHMRVCVDLASQPKQPPPTRTRQSRLVQLHPQVTYAEPVGDMLFHILENECKITPPADCGCKALQGNMNKWGCNVCDKTHRNLIIKHKHKDVQTSLLD